MNAFAYRDGGLHAENVSLETIAETYGTPVYVYSQAAIEDAYREFAAALDGLDAKICYGVKANGNLAVIRALGRLGAGADVVSGGELARATAAGIRPEDIVFSGVGKTRDEMAQALKTGIGQLNVESEAELAALGQVAESLGVSAPTAIRVNPDIAVDTADKIATGRYEHKFGIPIEDAARIYERGSRTPGIRMVGLAAHIGSQILDLSPFESAFAALAESVQGVRRAGFAVERLDLGGGLGITYIDETAPSLADFADIVRRTVGGLGCEITVEPGRRLVGNAGVLLSRVLYSKETPVRRFVIVDAAMNDLLRPDALRRRTCRDPGGRAGTGGRDPPGRRGGPGLRNRRLARAGGRSARARRGRPGRDRRCRRLRSRDGIVLQWPWPRPERLWFIVTHMPRSGRFRIRPRCRRSTACRAGSNRGWRRARKGSRVDDPDGRTNRKPNGNRRCATAASSFSRVSRWSGNSSWRGLWPALSVAVLFLALALSGVLPLLPGWLHALALAALLGGFLVLLWTGVRGVGVPDTDAGRRRLERESGFRHRPLQTLEDRLADGVGGPDAEALWQEHRERVARSARRIRIGLPQPGVAARDPMAIRFAAALLVVIAATAAWPDAGKRLREAVSPGIVGRRSGRGTGARSLDYAAGLYRGSADLSQTSSG